MDEQKTAFLLELLISRVVSHVATGDPVGFILHYRLDETTAENVMNEVGHIADEVRSGAAVTKSQAFARVVHFYKLGTGSGGPTLFVSDAFRAWAPDTWEKMTDT